MGIGAGSRESLPRTLRHFLCNTCIAGTILGALLLPWPCCFMQSKGKILTYYIKHKMFLCDLLELYYASPLFNLSKQCPLQLLCKLHMLSFSYVAVILCSSIVKMILYSNRLYQNSSCIIPEYTARCPSRITRYSLLLLPWKLGKQFDYSNE